jgi:NADPH:quinone reductase-like Zn-dependent oxidoreductase
VRRIVVRRPGGHDRLAIEEAPDREPGRGEVALAVEAIGINYADCLTRMGLYAPAREYGGFPVTPGFEVAGTVTAIGPEVEGTAAGARVMAVTRFGGYATRLVIPSERVFPLPESFSMAEGATFPVAFLTAYFALLELAHPRAGDRMLVHSAAGGVGGALVQVGAVAGCEIVGVVGAPHKVEAVKRLGAHHVIDASSEDPWATAERLRPRGYDIVLDAGGPRTLRRSYEHLAPMGRLVVYGFHGMLPKGRSRPDWLKLAIDALRMPRFNPLRLTAENRSVLGFNLAHLFGETAMLAKAMAELDRWVREERIHPLPVTRFAFERAAEAHRQLESGDTVGKLALIA